MISVAILVKNSASTLAATLESTKYFPEAIVIDTGSLDRSLEIAQSFSHTKVYQYPFTTFAKLRNLAASLASNDWILALDADEVLSRPLQEELLKLEKKPDCIYALPFINFFQGKKVTTAGWQKKSHLRLYHRQKTEFLDAKVHEKLDVGARKIITLHSPVFHTPYQTIDDFLLKMQRYSTLFAEQYVGEKKSSPWIACIHGFGTFLKSFFLKKGFLGGYSGFLISMYNGHTAFYKYLKLYHANNEKGHRF